MEIVFVYNADGGLVNSMLNTAHKVVSPATYSCSLCALTFGSFRENSRWKKYRENAKWSMAFYHKDEFETQFASKWLPKYSYPVILIAENQNLEVLLNAAELDSLENVEQLIEGIEKAIKTVGSY